MIGQGELRTPHAAREHEQKLYVPPSGDIIIIKPRYIFGFLLFIVFISNPLPPPPHRPPPIQPPPKQYTSLQIVSSLTIHPFINQLMSNGIVKPFLHKKL